MECWASILSLTFGTTWTSELSALRAGRNLPSRKFLDTNLCYRLSGAQGYWQHTERLYHLKISKDRTRNGTRDLRSCCAEPQPAAPTLASRLFCKQHNTEKNIFHVREVCFSSTILFDTLLNARKIQRATTEPLTQSCKVLVIFMPLLPESCIF
jgi:hypothetical protein